MGFDSISVCHICRECKAREWKAEIDLLCREGFQKLLGHSGTTRIEEGRMSMADQPPYNI